MGDTRQKQQSSKKWKTEFPESERNRVHQEKEETAEGKLNVAPDVKNTLTEVNTFVDRWMSRWDAAEERAGETETLENLFKMKQEGQGPKKL